MTKKFPKATEGLFEPSRFRSAKDKALEVNAVVRFLNSGMDPAKLTRRAYLFFCQTLSMSACYNIAGFKFEHLEDNERKANLLRETRREVNEYALLDPERNADIATLFAEPGECAGRRWSECRPEDGMYAELLTEEYHGLRPHSGRTCPQCGHQESHTDPFGPDRAREHMLGHVEAMGVTD